MSSAAFSPKVHTIARPTRHHALLVAPGGDWLGAPFGQTVATQQHVDDDALWEAEGDGFRHVTSGVALRSRPGGAAGSVRLSHGEADLGADGAPGPAADFTVSHGPEKRPSQYLTAIPETGWVVLPAFSRPMSSRGCSVSAASTATKARGTCRASASSPTVRRWPAPRSSRCRCGSAASTFASPTSSLATRLA